jgi:hypothetical protein
MQEPKTNDKLPSTTNKPAIDKTQQQPLFKNQEMTAVSRRILYKKSCETLNPALNSQQQTVKCSRCQFDFQLLKISQTLNSCCFSSEPIADNNQQQNSSTSNLPIFHNFHHVSLPNHLNLDIQIIGA